MRTSALFGAKNFGFFKLYDVSARTRESIFRDFVRTSFIDGPLCHVKAAVVIKRAANNSWVVWEVYSPTAGGIVGLGEEPSARRFLQFSIKMT